MAATALVRLLRLLLLPFLLVAVTPASGLLGLDCVLTVASTCTTTQLITLSSASVIGDLTAQFDAQLGVGYNWQNAFVYLPLPLSATLTYVIYDPNYDASKYAVIKSIQDDIMAKLCHGGLLGVKIDVSIGAVCASPTPSLSLSPTPSLVPSLLPSPSPSPSLSPSLSTPPSPSASAVPSSSASGQPSPAASASTSAIPSSSPSAIPSSSPSPSTSPSAPASSSPSPSSSSIFPTTPPASSPSASLAPSSLPSPAAITSSPSPVASPASSPPSASASPSSASPSPSASSPAQSPSITPAVAASEGLKEQHKMAVGLGVAGGVAAAAAGLAGLAAAGVMLARKRRQSPAPQEPAVDPYFVEDDQPGTTRQNDMFEAPSDHNQLYDDHVV